ncbi:unnamed protein product [Calypogeia fissa]
MRRSSIHRVHEVKWYGKISDQFWVKGVSYTDPDFLNASFLFYDENKDLRRVKIDDTLDTTKLGYVYQAANDADGYTPLTRCSTSSFLDLIAQAGSLPHKHKR